MRGRLISSTLTYTFLTFLQPAISFFLLPLYLSHLTIEEYGILSLISTFTYLIGGIAAFRIFSSIHTLYYDYRDSRRKLETFFGEVMGFSILAGIIFLIILSFLGDSIFNLVFKNDIPFYPYGFLGALSGISISLYQPYLSFMRNEERLGRFAFITLLLATFTAVFQIWFVAYIEWGLFGVLLGRAIGTFCVGVICITLTWQRIRLTIRSEYIKNALKFSIPLLPFVFISLITTYLDRYIFEQQSTLEILGLYTLLSTICLLIIMACDGLIGGIQPFLYDLYTRNPLQKRRIQKIQIGFFHILLFFTSFILLLFASLEWWLPDSDYSSILFYLPVGSIIFYLYSFYSFFRLNLLFLKKTKTLSMVSVIYLVILFIAFLLLIPRYEIWGALLGSLVGNIFLGIVTYIILIRIDHIWKMPGQVFFLPLLLCAAILGCFEGAKLLSSLHYAHAAIAQFTVVTLTLYVKNKSVLQDYYIKLRLGLSSFLK